jgi:hypothetical protein
MNILRIAAKIARIAARIVNEEALKELDPITVNDAQKEIGDLIESFRQIYVGGKKGGNDKEKNKIYDDMVLILLRLPEKEAIKILNNLEDRGRASFEYLSQIKPSRNIEGLGSPPSISPAGSEETTKVEGKRSKPAEETSKVVVPLGRLHGIVRFKYNQLNEIRKESDKVLKDAFKDKTKITMNEINEINEKAKQISPSYGDKYFQDVHLEIAKKMLAKGTIKPEERDRFFRSITKMPFALYLSSFKYCPESLDLMRQRQRTSSNKHKSIYLNW